MGDTKCIDVLVILAGGFFDGKLRREHNFGLNWYKPCHRGLRVQHETKLQFFCWVEIFVHTIV